MSQSIIIAKYVFPVMASEIYTKLSKPKFKIKYTDKNDADKQIELEHEVFNLKHTSVGVEGQVKYRYQKENEFKGDGSFDVTHEEFAFLFAPMQNFVILHGKTTFRIRLMKFFAYVLHDGDDIFESILITKQRMHKIMDKILRFKSGKNNLRRSTFFSSQREFGKPEKDVIHYGSGLLRDRSCPIPATL